jgi:hypothetical protein
VTVVLVPVPDVVTAPGVRVNVHVPVPGKPLSATLPVTTVQAGCVMVPATGAVGVAGCAFIITSDDDAEVQPSGLVTV